MKYPIGTKVKLLSKLNHKLEGNVFNKMKRYNQDFAFVTGYDLDIYDKPRYIINTDIHILNSGDFYYESDLKSYISYERKLKIQKINNK